MALGPLKLAVLKAPIRGRMGMILRVAMLLVIFAVAIGFVWSATRSNSRVVLLEMETQVLTMRSLGQGTAWNLPGAIICIPLEAGFDPMQEPGYGPCDARRYEVSEPEDLTLEWLDGDTARIAINATGMSVTLLTPQGEARREGTRIVVPREGWPVMGILTFAAEIVVGAPLQPGLSAQLLDGRWEMRQSGWAIAPGRRDVTEVVKAGDVMRGMVVEVRENCADGARRGRCAPQTPAVMYGHILPVVADTATHIDLVAISAPGRTELSIEHFGSTAPSVVRPSLLDFAITSPLLLALAFLFSIVASLAQVFTSLNDAFRASRKL
ncbi:MAG: hypothetical protein AAFQ59_20140 [Pseudomonadota bacterium]